MTQAIIETLCRIRKQEPQIIAVDKDNRYKLTVSDNDCEEAYFFSAPIVCSHDGNIASMNFFECGNGEYKLVGTNSNIFIKSKEIIFCNPSATIKVQFNETYHWNKVGNGLVSGNTKIVATTNGITIHRNMIEANNIELYISSNNGKFETRANSKYFAIMEHRHVPSFVLSAIGAINCNDILYPVIVNHVRNEDGFRVKVSSPNISEGEMIFEMNMYEHKMIQDTTVEVKRPKENNAFGGVAFLGESTSFGEQRLYMKLDYIIISELNRKKLSSMNLYIPIFGNDNVKISAYEMNYRFCSFGSTWNNKVLYGDELKPVKIENGFCVVDISDIMIDYQHRLKFSNGILLKVSDANGRYCALATGDSCNTAPILEVKYFE